MRNHYTETLWDQIVNGHQPWNDKGPFLGKKKVLRLLRVGTRVLTSLVCVETTMALSQNGY